MPPYLHMMVLRQSPKTGFIEMTENLEDCTLDSSFQDVDKTDAEPDLLKRIADMKASAPDNEPIQKMLEELSTLITTIEEFDPDEVQEALFFDTSSLTETVDEVGLEYAMEYALKVPKNG